MDLAVASILTLPAIPLGIGVSGLESTLILVHTLSSFHLATTDVLEIPKTILLSFLRPFS